MRTSTRTLITTAAMVIAGAPLAAQNSHGAHVLELVPYAGYMLTGNYLEGPLGLSLNPGSGPLYGAQLGVSLAPAVSLYANVASTGGDLQIGVPFLAGLNVGSSSMLMYDAGIQLALPSLQRGGRGISPFVQGGAGGIHHELSQSIVHIKATNFAANVGLGADFGISRDISFRLMAKDYIGKFDTRQATGFDLDGVAGMSAVRSNNWALTAGLRLDF